MKYALVNNFKTEAKKGVKGTCPSCGTEVIAKVGQVKINHWAHKGRRTCDHWWENETEWHRAWKNNFPIEWQEVIHKDKSNSEKHIADVKTLEGIVIEFQHSLIDPNERIARNNFYQNIIWVVDALRRKRDKPKLEEIFKEGRTIETDNFQFTYISFPEDSRILSEWKSSEIFIFLDVGETNLVTIVPSFVQESTYLLLIKRDIFIELLSQGNFNELQSTIKSELHEFEKLEQIEIEKQLKLERQRNLKANYLKAVTRRHYKGRRRGWS